MSELYKQLYQITAEDPPYVPLFFLFQGFPWNNEYFTGIKDQVEPWYWLYGFRGMLMFIDKANP
jgi:ABC-type transport system substrate-binding protein